ncbi:MAG: fluoride efflux transporter FluC [Bacteroidales bacterium]
MAKSILIVGLGGFIGIVLRFLTSRYLQINCTTIFLWSTFLVNIIGSFLVGIFFGISERGNIMSPEWRIFLTIGVCDGFTTFSSLSNAAFILLQNRGMQHF